MRPLTVWTIAIAATLAALSPAWAAGTGPRIAAGKLTSYCRAKAAANYAVRPARINVMGASQVLDKSWAVVGTVAVGKSQKDFMCTYDANRRFVGLTRLD